MTQVMRIRHHETYRGAVRNAFRRMAGDWTAAWRAGQFWQQANAKARLGDRAAQCREARLMLATMLPKVFALRTPMTGAVETLLWMFWLDQRRTRVVSRILKQLMPMVREHRRIALGRA